MIDFSLIDPQSFGRTMFRNMMFEPLDPSMFENSTKLERMKDPTIIQSINLQDTIIKFGIFLVYSFLEASKKYNDNEMREQDKQNLVHYWLTNSIPLLEMFYGWIGLCDAYAKKPKTENLTTRPVVFRGIPIPSKHKSNPKPKPTKNAYELDDSTIEYITDLLEKIYPNLIRDLKDIYDKEISYEMEQWRGCKG